MPKHCTLIVLHDVEDLVDAERSAPQSLHGDVIAFETNVHLALLDRGIEHRTPWDVIGRDELAALQQYERRVLDHWHTHAHLDFEGVDLVQMAGYRHLSALARLCWAAYAARRFIAELRPERVWAFEETPAHGLDQPIHHRGMPLLSGLVRGAAAMADIPVDLVPRKGPGFEDWTAAHRNVRAQPIDVGNVLDGRPVAVFQANRTDLLRQLPLIGALRDRLGCQVVQLYKDADRDIVRQVVAAGHHVWHESQVVRPVDASYVEPAAARARRRVAAISREQSDELRLIFDNPHAASHFDFLFSDYARRMAGHVLQWRDFFARCRPAAFVCNYHAPIYDVAADLGIPCLGLSHALMMIGQPQWYASLPRRSLIGAFTDLHRQRLIEHGIAADRIRITGDPWSDEARNQIRKADATPAEALRTRLGVAPERKVILLCTGSFGMPAKNTTIPTMDWAEGVRSMLHLGKLARRRPDLAFVVKPHPRFDYPALYARVNRELPRDRRLIVSDTPLPELGHCADVICMWNTASSVIVEASLLDRPVLLFSRCLVWCDLAAWAINAWPRVETIEQFEAEIDLLLGAPEHRAARIAESKLALRRFVDGNHGDSTARCLDVLDEMIASSAVASSSGG